MKRLLWLGTGFIALLLAGAAACSSPARNFGSESAGGVGNVAGTTASSNHGGSGDGGASVTAQAGDTGLAGEAGQTAVPDGPSVIAVSPGDLATNAEPSASITVQFSEPLNPATVTLVSVQVKNDQGTAIDGAVSYSKAVATFIPSARLDLLATYTVAVSTDITDAAGIPLKQPFSSSFAVRDGAWGTEAQIPTSTVAAFGVQDLQLANDGLGHAIAVWVQYDTSSAQNDLFASIYAEGIGWGVTTLIGSTAAAANCQKICDTAASVAMNGAGDAIVGWLQSETASSAGSVDKLNVAARLYKAGAWQATKHNLDNQATTSRAGVTVGMSQTGEAHVLWLNNGGSAFVAYAERMDPTGTWNADPSSLLYTGSSPSLGSLSVSFAPNGDGFAVANGYDSSGSGIGSVVASRFLESSKQWSAGVVLDSGSWNAGVQALSLDAAGNATAVWRTEDNSLATALKASQYDKIWSAPVVINQGNTEVDSVALAATPAGFIAAWTQFTGAVNNVTVNQLGTSWGMPVILGNGDYSGESPALAADPRGNALLIWEQQASDQSYNVAFSRFAGGAQTWSDPDLVEDTAGGIEPDGGQLVILSDGVAMAVWIPDTGVPHFSVFQ